MGKKRKKDRAEKQAKMRAALAIVAKGVKGMDTVNHLEEERFVPTIITSYNRATGLGGHPIRKMTAVHGKNSTGKSVLALALGESCRRHGHIPIVYEAEYAEEARWYNRLVLGNDTLFKHPETLDELFTDVQKNLSNLAAGKIAGQIDPGIGICFIIDTLTKLIPQEMLDTLITKGFKKSWPLQAMWVSMWSKVIVPQAYRANSSFVIVLQERINQGAGQFQKKRKVTLGEALLYDVAVRVECYRSEAVKKTKKKKGESESKEEKKANPVLGSRFDYKLAKNKVDGWTDAEGCLFTSTGRGDVPAGFDHVREAIHEARLRGVLRSRKNDVVATFKLPDGDKQEFRFSGGLEDVRERLQADPEMFEAFVDRMNEDARRVE